MPASEKEFEPVFSAAIAHVILTPCVIKPKAAHISANLNANCTPGATGRNTTLLISTQQASDTCVRYSNLSFVGH
jgi:hypothetical protein